MINEIETILKTVLTGLTGADEKAIFRTVELWDNQITPGGKNSFERFAPFVFIKYLPADYDRAGDGDLVRNLDFAITIGTHGQDARSECLDLLERVIQAIDKKHPNTLDAEAAAISCDELVATDEAEIVDAPKQYAMSVIFTAKKV